MIIKALIVGKDIAKSMMEHESFVPQESSYVGDVMLLGTMDGIQLYLDTLLKPGKMIITHQQEDGEPSPDYVYPDGVVPL